MQQVSGSSRQLDLDSPAFHTPQTRRRKRPKAHAARQSNSTYAPVASASASSWGAADVSDDVPGNSSSSGVDYEVYSSSSETDDDDAAAAADGQGYEDPSSGASCFVPGLSAGRDHASRRKQLEEEEQQPARKRRVLASEDVGRFANLSIDARIPQTLHPTSITEPQRDTSKITPSDEVNDAFASTLSGLRQAPAVSPSAVEEPDGDNEQSDTDMRSRKGPRTLKVDNDRFYVTSLSDSSSDEEAEEAAKEERAQRKRTAKALQGASEDEIAGLIASEKDSTQYLINGELVSRLQAVDWQRQIALGRAKTAATPLFNLNLQQSEEQAKQDQALVIWRDPQHISTRFTANAGQANAIPASLQPIEPPPVVYDDGDYAYVKRPPDEPVVPASADEGMEIDS